MRFPLLLAIAMLTATTARAATLQPVASLLEALRRAGVEVNYSSDLVPPTLLAAVSTVDTDPLTAAKNALAAVGLELQLVSERRYVVTRASATPQSSGDQASRVEDAPLADVSVYASRYALERLSAVEPKAISSPDIQSIPGSHDDALRALRALPGLASNASGRPYIRGSLSNDVLIRFDGITLVDPYHLKGFQSLISAIDPAAVDRIDVYSAGYPVRYGTRSGGVIDITPPTRETGQEHTISATLLTAGGSSIGHSDRWPLNWLVAARRSTLDLLEPVASGFGSPRFSDTLGRLRWSPTQGSAWTLGWLLLNDRIRLGVQGDEELAFARYRDEYVWLAQERRFGDRLRANSSLTVTSSERTRDGRLVIPAFANGRVQSSLDFERWDVSSDWYFDRNDNSGISFGGAYTVTQSTLAYERQAEFSPDVAAAFARAKSDDLKYNGAPEERAAALYGAHRQRWGKLNTELGLRLDVQDYDSSGVRAQWSPRLNLRYEISEGLRLYASVGSFKQAQQLDEWRAEEAQQSPDPAQRAWHSVVGLEYATDSAFRFVAETYVKRWTAVSPYFDAQLDPLSLLPDLAVDRIRLAPQSSEAAGLELSVRSPFSASVNGWGTLTWSRVADDFGRVDIVRSWNQPLALTAGLTWSGPRANLSGVLGWHRGWPRTPVTLPGGDGIPLTLGTRNAGRWGDFYSFDLRGAWTWPRDSGALTLFAEITNATDRRNDCCVSFERDGAPLGPLEAEIDQWLPILFNLGITFRWGDTQ